MEFRFFPLRFAFVAQEPINFPAGRSSNILRGAFGVLFRRLVCRPECIGPRFCPAAADCPYARLFEPSALGPGPSGLKNRPRPFVFRASHLDGCTLRPGESFHFDLNLFDLHYPAAPHFIRAFSQLAQEGLGARRRRVSLVSVTKRRLNGQPARELMAEVDAGESLVMEPEAISLLPQEADVARVTVRFVTPTELKSGHMREERPEFAILAARIRDRISMLSTFYGDGPLEIDFRAFGDRAAAVRLTRCDLTHVAVERRSSRTGQVHPLGGFVGEAEYEGPLTEFIPFLRVAAFTGVGRQTVWGKGQIELRQAGLGSEWKTGESAPQRKKESPLVTGSRIEERHYLVEEITFQTSGTGGRTRRTPARLRPSGRCLPAPARAMGHPGCSR